MGKSVNGSFVIITNILLFLFGLFFLFVIVTYKPKPQNDAIQTKSTNSKYINIDCTNINYNYFYIKDEANNPGNNNVLIEVFIFEGSSRNSSIRQKLVSFQQTIFLNVKVKALELIIIKFTLQQLIGNESFSKDFDYQIPENLNQVNTLYLTFNNGIVNDTSYLQDTKLRLVNFDATTSSSRSANDMGTVNIKPELDPTIQYYPMGFWKTFYLNYFDKGLFDTDKKDHPPFSFIPMGVAINSVLDYGTNRVVVNNNNTTHIIFGRQLHGFIANCCGNKLCPGETNFSFCQILPVDGQAGCNGFDEQTALNEYCCATSDNPNNC